MTPEIRRARRAFIWVGVVLPAVITVLSTLVVLIWLPQLPDPAATHWSGGAAPDGFGPAWTYPAIGFGVPAVAIVLIAVLVLLSHRIPPRSPDGPQWSPTARFLGALSLGLSGMMSVTTLVSVGVQRGLADAADAPDITPWVFAGLGLMLALGVLGWFLQPAVPAGPAGADTDAAPLPLAGDERAVWYGSVAMARSGQIVLGIALVLMLIGTAAVVAIGDPRAMWIMIGTTLLLIVAAAAGVAFRVRVSAEGLRVRSVLGWPTTRIRLESIEKAEVVTVSPFAEFGGWGWRIAVDGRRGIVLRTGQALQVVHGGGRVFVVTVDDAATAAGLLNALRERAASAPGRPQPPMG